MSKRLLRSLRYTAYSPLILSVILTTLTAILYIKDYFTVGLKLDSCVGAFTNNSFANVLLKASYVSGELTTILISAVVIYILCFRPLPAGSKVIRFLNATAIVLSILCITSVVMMFLRHSSFDRYLDYLSQGTTAYGENRIATTPVRFFFQSTLLFITVSVCGSRESLITFSKKKRAVVLSILNVLLATLLFLIFLARAEMLLHDSFFYHKSFNTRYIAAVASTYHLSGFLYLLLMSSFLIGKMRQKEKQETHFIQ